MDKYILENLEIVIKNFNESFTETINKNRENLINNLEKQIKTDFVEKLNGEEKKVNSSNKSSLDEIIDIICKCINEARYNDSNNFGNYHNGKNYQLELFLNFINKIILNPDEYIINWKYEYCNYDTNNAYNNSKKLYCLIFTNYGSFFCINGLLVKIYKGQYILPEEYTYIFNEFIESITMTEYNTTQIYIRNNYNRPTDKIPNMLESVRIIIEKVQTDYFTRPLIGYKAQQVIDENNKLKKENEKTRKLYDKITKEKEEIAKNKEVLDNKMIEYNGINNLKQKWDDLKKIETRLADYEKILKEDRIKLEGEKEEFEKNKLEHNIKNSSLSKTFNEFIKESDDDNICKLCCDEIEVNIALIPCGHANYCKRCIDDLEKKECPICREGFKNTLRIYK